MLIAAAAFAMLLANSPLKGAYTLLIETPVVVQIGQLEIAKPLLLWINDGLMAIFFFVVGLELKRELLEGELSNRNNIILPAIGAVGGMAAPALIYVAFNYSDPIAINGWAIPSATDIAFALGVLMLLGSRVPISLKIFLTSLAVFDDMGAVIIIALFYTSKLSLVSLAFVAACVPILAWLNFKGVATRKVYLIIGAMMWVAMLKSGVHATLTGVLLAFFVPLKSRIEGYSPLKKLEHDLHSIVAFAVLPIFAFANAGIDFSSISKETALHGVTFGIALGLFFGKIIGVFGLCWLTVKLRIAKLPRGMTMHTLFGTSALCGIGFTMSLFIGSLAFQDVTGSTPFDERLGILIGSLVSGVVGIILLKKYLPTYVPQATSNH